MTQKNNWYASFPVIDENFIYFASAENIYKVKINGNEPNLIFQGKSLVKNLAIHKNKLAFTACENGAEDIYILDLDFHSLEQITFFQEKIKTTYIDDETLLFLTNKSSPFSQNMFLYEYNFKTKEYKNLNIGPANWATKNKQDYYLQKYEYGYLNWHGYQGGTAGILFKNESRILNNKGNFLRPFIYEEKVYFIWDNEISGNLYCCNKDGSELTQLTFHNDFQIQNIYLNAGKIIYTKLGQIFVYNIKTKKDTQIQLKGTPFFPQISKINAHNISEFITSIETNSEEILVAARGNIFLTKPYPAPIKKLNKILRFKHTGFTHKNEIFAFKEAPNSQLHIYADENKVFNIPDQKIQFYQASPVTSHIGYINHTHELKIINYETGQEKVIFKGTNPLYNFDWSSDGKWIVYCAVFESPSHSQIRLYNLEIEKHYDLTDKNHDYSYVTFDPAGKYIAFISNAEVKVARDALKFDYTFVKKQRAYIINLQKDNNVLNPWENKKDEEKKELQIDLENIQERVARIPFYEDKMHTIIALPDSKLLLVHNEKKHIKFNVFSFNKLCTKKAFENLEILSFNVSNDRKSFILETAENAVVMKLDDDFENLNYKKDGLKFSQLEIENDAHEEWEQIIEETCWLIKEFYWSEKLAGVNWKEVEQKYKNLSKIIKTREELEEILNHLQGELGTSHSFILSSNVCEYKSNRGYLGIRQENGKIKKILDSDLESGIFSPFKQSGKILENETITHINDCEITNEHPLEKALANKANKWISLKINNTDFQIKALACNKQLEYKTWVNENRKYVHEKTDSKIGYIHFSDMGKEGFSQFYKQYLNEYQKDAVIIDVRYNRGGNISGLILDQLRRVKTGVDLTRHYGIHEIPHESSNGNFVLLINAHSASDAEIFSHQFKMLKMGEVIGERTWGGVVGILPRYTLIDNTLMSYPEFATWFEDVEYKLENEGVIPDYEIMNPHMLEFSQENDLQLKKAIELALNKPKSKLKEKALASAIHPIRKK